MSPFANWLAGCTGGADTADYILPIVDFPQYARTPENIRSSCSRCNQSRGARYTDAEHNQVLVAIAERAERRCPPLR
ncbi:HNH endonuclease [Mycolicibacter heraklionensis]|uniref:HNH endonuclease n=1 Tax=Mycolicibacter heraklionensis TaxID=512402 RepID=UPI0012FF26C7